MTIRLDRTCFESTEFITMAAVLTPEIASPAGTRRSRQKPSSPRMFVDAFGRPAVFGLKMRTLCPADGVAMVIQGKRPLSLTRVDYNRNTTRLSGSVAVRSDKVSGEHPARVFVRYTTNGWKTHADVDSHFLCERHFSDEEDEGDEEYETRTGSVAPGRVGVDFYAFSIRLGRLLPGQRVEFVLMLEEAGEVVFRDDECGPKHAAEMVALSSPSIWVSP
eukprot:comp25949_c0_seq1/m.47054 comp25949_c0_seq1/g.47054  ORF comp25949_c0_seq1/g.47054 comp25949_c0_seq1/m.47054 type:complete len:219 (-) comp25949_c0_seq1:112-768(-)